MELSRSGFKLWIPHLVAVEPQTNYLTFPSSVFCLVKENKQQLLNCGVMRFKWHNFEKWFTYIANTKK